MSLSQEDRLRIVTEAKTWLNTPWHHQAAVKRAGVDCAMFIRAVFVSCGLVPAFKVEPYPQQWALHHNDEWFLETLKTYGRVTVDTLPGNVIVWKFGRCYSHGGIIVEWPIIIHAYQPVKSVVYEDMSCSPLRLRSHKFCEVGT